MIFTDVATSEYDFVQQNDLKDVVSGIMQICKENKNYVLIANSLWKYEIVTLDKV